jgi:hypothetical protein
VLGRRVPSVTVTAANGSDLRLRQVPSQQFSPQPAPPQTAITLAPHTGTTRTTLYWYLPWCGPDPNPVTVTITLPADGAHLTLPEAGSRHPATAPIPAHRATRAS